LKGKIKKNTLAAGKNEDIGIMSKMFARIWGVFLFCTA